MNDLTINADVTMTDGGQAILVNRFRVVKPLGQGGMGSVWLAEDTKLDGFKVAIKMLPSVLVNNKRAYAQVKQEALVSLRLSHPNIATVRAFEEEGGSPFLVIDYIDGQTLDDYLAEKGRLSEEETLRLLKPVAAALDYAHGEGVVHRDVKPANVMIRRDGHPFILDFGIAREIQETLTRVTGKLSSGTLVYMSPEQLRGELPTPVQDVYSFAAMAYECLNGTPPFSRGQIEYQILNEPPPPLPDGLRLAPSVLRGLSKAPDARPGSCAGVLDSDSRVPRAPSPVPCAEKPREVAVPQPSSDSKSPLLWLLAALAAVALGGMLWNGVRQQSELVANRTAVQRPAAEAKVDAPEMVDMIELDRTRIEAQVMPPQPVQMRSVDPQGERMDEALKQAKNACFSARQEAQTQGAEVHAANAWAHAESLLAKARCDPRTVTKSELTGFYFDAMYAYKSARETAITIKGKPVVYLTASLDGVPKHALVTKGIVDSGLRTPLNVDINHALGTSGTFEVEYAENGIKYGGRAIYTARQGRQVVNIELIREGETQGTFGQSPNFIRCGEVDFAPVYFGEGNLIDEGERIKIDCVVQCLQAHPDWVVQLEGHTDARGGNEFNLARSDLWAQMVRNELVARGVNPLRVQAIGRGEEHPAVRGEGEVVWARNRRVEFQMFKRVE